jgi:hypothetical protein
MLIICNGMPRSASTWSFNVVLGLLRNSYSGVGVYGGYSEAVAQFLESIPLPCAHVVLKCHTLDAVGRILAQSGAAKVIFTSRDIADAAASFMAMFNHSFEHALDVMDSALELHRFHLGGGNAVILRYDEVMSDPPGAVRRIAEYLGLPVDSEIIREVAAETSFERMSKKVRELDTIKDEGRLVRLPSTSYDPATLLNINHIRDGRSGYGQTVLTAEQLKMVAALIHKYDRSS